MASTATPAPADLADRFTSLRRAVHAQARAARSCVRFALDAVLLFLLARQLRRIERILRAIPPQAGGPGLPTHPAGPHLAPEYRLTRHGRLFIPRCLRPEILHPWWVLRRGARAIPGRLAPRPRPHAPRAPPPRARRA